MSSVAVVVLNYNGLDDTLKCLESLSAIEAPAPLVILVDNASTIDPTDAAIRLLPGVEVIRNATNMGYAGGNNRGISRALDRGAEFVLILNNDTVVAPKLIELLVAAFASDASLGIVGPVINFLDEPARVMTDGVTFNPGPGTEFFRRIEVPAKPSEATPQQVDIVNGCCMMVRAEVFRSIGMLDESFFIVHEESDFCLRANAARIRCAVLGQTLVWHKGSGSFERTGRQLQRYFDTRNLYFLLKRHTGKVGASRPFGASLWHYVLYTFYRYDIELEAGKQEAAEAIVEGLYDAICGASGPYQKRQRLGLGAARAGLNAARFLSHLRRRRPFMRVS